MRCAMVLALILAAATPALAEEYYWGAIEYDGLVHVDGWGDWGEIGFAGDDYYVTSYDFGDWIFIEADGDIIVDGRYWGYMDYHGDVYRDDTGYLLTIDYDWDRDEYHYDGVYAFDPQTVFFVLAFEEKFFGWEVGLEDVFDFNQPPLARFESRTDGSMYRIAFAMTASDLDGEIDGVRWDFGDGTVSEAGAPLHVYDRAGIFTVRLTVWDDGGASFTTVRTVTIKSRPPKARFKKKKVRGVRGGVLFRERSRDRNGTVVAWHWDFGDGHTSTDREPVHVYAAPGRYTVTLTVTDNDGETGQKIRGVKVRIR